jgi:uncharacterized surface protein with fasciclin (FAS1) repeats
MRTTRVLLLASVFSLAAFLIVIPTSAQTTNQVAASVPMVGGAPMYPTKNVVENASQATNLTTLVAAVKAGGLVSTLEGPGPFTVFAPTNAAFEKLPPGTVQNLLKPENKQMLDQILTYHVVPGSYTTQQLMAMAEQNDGTTMLKTVAGEPIKITSGNGRLYVEGVKSGVAEIITPNVAQSNGMVQVISSVLLPN